MRQLFQTIHLWVSLAFAVVIVAVCASGALLVYRHPIDRLLNPTLYAATAGDIGWDAVWAAARSRYPTLDTALIRGPIDRGVYQVEVGEGVSPMVLHVDPGTGRILGGRERERSAMGWLFTLHFNLFAGEFGHVVIGLSGLALAAISVTGAVLWWPSWKRFGFGWVVRLRRPWVVVNYDVHRVLGILTLPVVLIIAVTGTLLVFYGVGSRVVHAVFLTTPERAAPRLNTPPAAWDGSLPLTLSDAATRAVALAPGAAAGSMYIHGSEDPLVTVWLRTPGDVRPNVGSWQVRLNLLTGHITSAMLPSNTPMAAHVDETWIIALHFGTFRGSAVRGLWALGAIMPLVLLTTGVIQWVVRSRRRTRSASLNGT